ncbi:uncharacterized protein ARMOST_20708 [Armillaria ostoyae]|uniref:Uncharacterized protein n=1 Tax=Armillaria ostoyae TaxID=47428 RepID=A0A284S842_ARMOS|nr:uncharacterized protein ARMOST_20708 [Armillaria ostoyae]
MLLRAPRSEVVARVPSWLGGVSKGSKKGDKALCLTGHDLFSGASQAPTNLWITKDEAEGYPPTSQGHSLRPTNNKYNSSKLVDLRAGGESDEKKGIWA